MVTFGSAVNRLDEVKRFAVLEADDCFFPMVGTTGIGTTLALEFAVVVGSADCQDGFSEELFNSLFDFKLVGLAVHFEGDLVVVLLKHGGFLGETDVFNDLVNVFHDLGVRSGVQAVRAARVCTASPTRMMVLARRSCSTLTSEPVTSWA